jgi:hypothetical protein
MASNVQIKFDRQGKCDILTSPGTKALLLLHAQNVKKKAERMSESGMANYTVVIDEHKVSAHAHTWARDAATIASNKKHDALVRSLANEPGVTMHDG